MGYSEFTGWLVMLWCAFVLLYAANKLEEGISLLLLSSIVAAVVSVLRCC